MLLFVSFHCLLLCIFISYFYHKCSFNIQFVFKSQNILRVYFAFILCIVLCCMCQWYFKHFKQLYVLYLQCIQALSSEMQPMYSYTYKGAPKKKQLPHEIQFDENGSICFRTFSFVPLFICCFH